MFGKQFETLWIFVFDTNWCVDGKAKYDDGSLCELSLVGQKLSEEFEKFVKRLLEFVKSCWQIVFVECGTFQCWELASRYVSKVSLCIIVLTFFWSKLFGETFFSICVSFFLVRKSTNRSCVTRQRRSQNVNRDKNSYLEFTQCLLGEKIDLFGWELFYQKIKMFFLQTSTLSQIFSLFQLEQ